MQSTHPVQAFYKDKTILLTGATGFLGRAVLSKLLRDVPDLKRIYVLMRNKKDKSADQRLKELLFSIDPALTKRIEAATELLGLVTSIEGDLLRSDLGISTHDLSVLRQEVDVVISCAADIGFHRPLDNIIRTNVRGIIEYVGSRETKFLLI